MRYGRPAHIPFLGRSTVGDPLPCVPQVPTGLVPASPAVPTLTLGDAFHQISMAIAASTRPQGNGSGDDDEPDKPRAKAAKRGGASKGGGGSKSAKGKRARRDDTTEEDDSSDDDEPRRKKGRK